MVIGIRAASVFLAGLLASTASLAQPQPLRIEDRYAWFLPPASNAQQQGFVRLVNQGPKTATITVTGLDAAGQRSPGQVQLQLARGQSRQLNSQDLEGGNPGKGLSGALGDGDGDWSLLVAADQPIEALAYIRTPDGFLTAMHDRVRGDGQRWPVPFFNPAENINQVSRLRVVNTETRAVSVLVTGTDDAGQGGATRLAFSLPALASVEWTSSELEQGSPARGLQGALGDGSGKWRLMLEADGRVSVQSLLYDPEGNLTNLSTLAPGPVGPGRHTLWFFPHADNVEQQGFIRIINRGPVAGLVEVRGVDDAGQASPGVASFSLGPGQSRQFNAQDLEFGNVGKGLTGSLGDGQGDWRLLVDSPVAIEAMALVRTVDGFLTSVHDVVAGEAIRREVPVFNPAQNANQVSVLRLVNPTGAPVPVQIAARDETGAPGPAGDVRLVLAAGEGRILSATDLEAGNPGGGLTGRLGDGQGKWTLFVTSPVPIQVVSLLRAPRGFLTNLSTRARTGGGELTPVLPGVQVQRTQVSNLSPFAAGCEGVVQTGSAFVNAEVEPYLALNPIEPDNLVAVWQQDRWSNGSARGQGVASSVDGGATWSVGAMAFSRCGGGNAGNNGNYLRATDPWVSFGPTGVAHQMSLVTSGGSFQAGSVNGMSANRSFDGGQSWTAAISLILDGASHFNDKNAITADPLDASRVYAVWDRLASGGGGPAVFARSTNGGLSWEAARAIFDPGTNSQTIGNVIAVLPDGRLLNLFTQIDPAPGGGSAASVRVMRSSNQGQTWSAPVTVSPLQSIGASDPENGINIRDGSILAQFAVGPDGAVHVVWQDARFSGGARDGIAWSRSLDGGDTWSEPKQVNRATDVQAFMPSVFVLADGTVAITYYDLRSNTGASTLPTDYWLVRTRDGLHWTEDRLSGPFDLGFAPNANGLFVGDYQGLQGFGDDTLSLHVIANSDLVNRTDAWFARARPIAAPVTVLPPVAAAQETEKSGWRDATSRNLQRQLAARRQPPAR